MNRAKGVIGNVPGSSLDGKNSENNPKEIR